MKIEELDKVLSSYPTIEIIPAPESADPTEFLRDRYFKVNGEEYRIEWWVNICYLYIGENVQICFKSIKVSDTWPNDAKMNLQFYDEKNNVCAILKIDNH